MAQHTVSDEKRAFEKALRRKQTAPEVLLWRELRDRRLAGWKFRRQVPINGYVTDFVCLEAGLIIEVDGPLHRGPEQKAKDKQRDAILRGEGFRVLRFDAETGAGRILQVVREALDRSPHPPLAQARGAPSPARGEGDARPEGNR